MNYEKEEKWLNNIAAKGLAMTAYTFCRYTFEDCIPGEFIYRIEYLKHNINQPESIQYIRFMAENGVEHVDTHFRWVYFRKKSTNGDFKIYSDFTSQIQHYKRISNIWLIVGCMELCIGFSQIHMIIDSLRNGTQYWLIHAEICAIVLSLGVILLCSWGYYIKKIKRLEREREIHE